MSVVRGVRRFALAAAVTTAIAASSGAGAAHAAAGQIDVVGPAGSGSFGNEVVVLPNGNVVVTDPGFDLDGTHTDVGAVYLYNGATHALISTLTGSTTDDHVGGGGYPVLVLANGNFVVTNQFWDDPTGPVPDAGAVTWGSATTGVSGTVSASNSLVGSRPYDGVGSSGAVALTNGNYVTATMYWNLDGTHTGVGAVTWGNGATGTSGVVTAANSLVGSTSNDNVGEGGVTALANGNYVVAGQYWDNPTGPITNAGAVTWGNGSTAGPRLVGPVTAANSLVGASNDDRVGGYGATALSNGNYVVGTGDWDNPTGPVSNAGAATWGNGATGTSGPVTAANSLVGTSNNDRVGGGGLFALRNGNYVVATRNWDNPTGPITNAGAATWGNGSTAGPRLVGTVTAANSLVGTSNNDDVGEGGVTALSNGNYVVVSAWWNLDGTHQEVGAVTWGNGATGTSGPVTAANSLVGSIGGDSVGERGVTALSNGNYVVVSPLWNNPTGSIADAGAATWGNGSTAGPRLVGPVTAANSLVGGSDNDKVGGGVTALSNGNYVVVSTLWDNPTGPITNAGAATWANGSTAGPRLVGPVTAANSLTGPANGALVGSYGIVPLANGNYIVVSSDWTPDGTTLHLGAVTWGNGESGTNGQVTAANSLVGTTAEDYVGGNSVTALTSGNYLVNSDGWDNPTGPVANVGAAGWGNGSSDGPRLVGPVSADNSVLGAAPGGGIFSIGFDYVNHQLVVGRLFDNTVTWLPVPDTGPLLPPTGADTNGFVAVALVLLAAGALLVTVRRRRPRTA